MSGKRKRSKETRPGHTSSKRRKVSSNVESKSNVVKDSILSHYYERVVTLKEYILEKLPANSKIRRKRILSIGQHGLDGKAEMTSLSSGDVNMFLERTLVGTRKDERLRGEERLRQWTSFSQRQNTSVNESVLGEVVGNQSEVVDFIIWLLFAKGTRSTGKAQHLLLQGFKRAANYRALQLDAHQASTIPGLVQVSPNERVVSLKASPWPEILGLLGKEGEKIMIDLLLDCGIFIAIEGSRGSYHQLSGESLVDLQVRKQSDKAALPANASKALHINKEALSPGVANSLSNITFVRSRMFYGKAAQNASGGVIAGFRHIHVLNRFKYNPSSLQDEGQRHDQPLGHGESEKTIHVLMYIFPRQFGLHNVFTSSIDRRETVQRFRDYSLREDEISRKYGDKDLDNSSIKIPKRLRGHAVELVRKLRVAHTRCAYKKLLNYYCHPSSNAMNRGDTSQISSDESSLTFKTQVPTLEGNSLQPEAAENDKKISSRSPSVIDQSTSPEQVSAFCRSVLSKLIPKAFWGIGDNQIHNQSLFLRSVDQFIKLRRFENLSLHEVVQGMKISEIPWLAPDNNTKSRASKSDTSKRHELFNEFMYYLFDSLLIPLIHTNFYVTETNSHRYRVIYFRQDVWRTLAEPAISSLRSSMFEEVKKESADDMLNSRSLGYSHVRLLPKESGLRPIMNLRRRAAKGGQKYLASSINSLLAPVHNVFTFEKNMTPDRLGGTLFSVGELHLKLKAFKASLGHTSQALYFAKFDVQSAFDTIPQAAVLRLMSTIPKESVYRITKYAEVKPGEDYRLDSTGNLRSKPIRNFITSAGPRSDHEPFSKDLESGAAQTKKHTVFIDNAVAQFRDRDDLLHLLHEHVQNNMVKIGKKFYRQKVGIPQGSVLSSLLCNYFYADLEAQHLSFLQSEDTLLVRLIDDFLLITTNKDHARKFVQIMHQGVPEYGVSVNPAKTLVNFELSINDQKVKRLVDGVGFPYCGTAIDVRTLNIGRPSDRVKGAALADSLTVEFAKMPGKTFHRKIINTFKIQAHAMFLDTSSNSIQTVYHNLHEIFTESATKMWMYLKCLPAHKRPDVKYLIKTIEDLIGVAFLLSKSKKKKKGNEDYRCAVSKPQLDWIAISAFQTVLHRKQSGYRVVLAWLDSRIAKMRGKRTKKFQMFLNSLPKAMQV